MRAFVAVFPPPDVGQALIEAAHGLGHDGFRLIAPEKVHLTLKFLGDVSERDLARAAAALEPLRGGRKPFDIVTNDFGVFPSPRRARVLWAGVGEGTEVLSDLAGEVDALLESAGFGREARPYVPHLTLGRARRPVTFEDPGREPPASRFTVTGTDLVESVPGGGGVTYRILASYALRKGA